MSLLLRPFILSACTLAAFIVLGRAPGAISLRLRDIEAAIKTDGKNGRDKKVAIRPLGAKTL